MDIDRIRESITGDAQAVLGAQLESIQREIVQRLGINITTREAIHDLLAGVRHTILQLEPPDGAPDDAFRQRERFLLEHEHRALILRLSDEQRSCWNDIQRLRTEQRTVERELSTLRKRQARLP